LIWAGGQRESVVLVGQSYAINTIGAIAGAFLAGFVLIPKATTRFTVLFAASLCVIVAGFAYRPDLSKGSGSIESVCGWSSFAMVLVLCLATAALNIPR